MHSLHSLISNEEKVNRLKMYTGMYWNDIQLILLIYTHITFSLRSMLVLHNIQKWNYSRRSSRNGQHDGSWLSLTLPVFHAYIKT